MSCLRRSVPLPRQTEADFFWYLASSVTRLTGDCLLYRPEHSVHNLRSLAGTFARLACRQLMTWLNRRTFAVRTFIVKRNGDLFLSAKHRFLKCQIEVVSTSRPRVG